MELDPKVYKLLSKVNLPSDLREMDISKFPELCDEVRKFLLESVSKSSGHLASGLGVVELTVVIKPFSKPNSSLITLAKGAKQLVVHDAFETMS